MTPRLEACYFGGDRWRRLARVLDYSARRYCPGWNVNVQRIEAPTEGSPLGISGHVFNTRKLAWWTERIIAASDGERLLLVDADVVVLRPLDDLWSLDFDLAYTARPVGARFPLNAGVVAVRVSEKIRDFFKAWYLENDAVLHARREQARAKWGGCNQAALGVLFERMAWYDVTAHGDLVATSSMLARLGEITFRVVALPCAEWNCENENWAAAAPAGIRILHVKDQLRDRVFYPISAIHRRQHIPDPLAYLQPLADLWHREERDALASEEAQTA